MSLAKPQILEQNQCRSPGSIRKLPNDMKRRTLIFSALGGFVLGAMGKARSREDRVTSIGLEVERDLWKNAWPIMKGRDT